MEIFSHEENYDVPENFILSRKSNTENERMYLDEYQESNDSVFRKLVMNLKAYRSLSKSSKSRQRSINQNKVTNVIPNVVEKVNVTSWNRTKFCMAVYCNKNFKKTKVSSVQATY